MAEPPPTIPDHHLLRVIGRGSYGEVWLAQSIMGTLRAVKIVRRSSFDTERPYLREFEGIRKCEPVSRSHEGLIDVLHVGRVEDESFFYYVMELADDANSVERTASHYGEIYHPATLATRLNDGHPLPVEDCLQLAQSLAGALAQLHDFGLMHRDVKPSNIMYAEGLPKLGDIGLVAEASESRSYVGTEGYVPLEGPGSVKADLFALGKVLYQALTGLDRTRYPELPDGWSQQWDFDQRLELNEIVLKACEDDPERRYRNARELLADAAVVASGRSLKQLRQQARRLRAARWMGAGAAGSGLLAAGALLLSQSQVKSERERASREGALRLRAEAAERAAQSSRWDALYALTKTAPHNLAPGAVTEALAAAEAAAQIRTTPELRSATAALLGRDDLRPHQTNDSVATLLQGMVLLDLPNDRFLHFPADLTSPAQWWTLQGQPGQAMPAEFTQRHSWNFARSSPLHYLIDITDASRLWDLERGTSPGSLPSVDVVGTPQFTSRPEVIRARPPHDIVWFDPATAEELRHLTIPDWSASEISASPDGSLIVLNEFDQALRLIEADSGHELWRKELPGLLWPPVWSPDQRRIAVRQESRTQLISIPEGNQWAIDTGPDRGGDHVHFLGSRHWLAIANWSDVTFIEDVSLRVPRFRIPGGSSAADFVPATHLLVLSGWKQGARLFDWSPSPVLRILRELPPGVLGCTFSQEDRWLFTMTPHGLQAWSLDAQDLASTPIASTLTHGILPLFDRASEHAPTLVDGRYQEIFLNSEGGMIASSAQPPAEDFTPPAQLADATFGGNHHAIHASQSGNGQTRAIVIAGEIFLWKNGLPLPGLPTPISSDVARLSADGRWLAVRRLGDLPAMMIWSLPEDATAPQLLHEELGPGVWPTFSEDGHWLACGSEQENWIMDTSQWKIAARWPRHTHGSYGVCAFTHDGKWLITQETSDDLTFRRIGTWEIELQLQSPLAEQLRFPTLSPTGRWLAAFGFRNEVYAWDLFALQRELAKLGLGLP